MDTLLSDNLPDSYWLVLDSCAPTLQIGLFLGNNAVKILKEPADATETLLERTDQLLREAGVTIDDIQHFAYCQGPGSILGTRISVMAIKTWVALGKGGTESRVYAYHSLAAAFLQQSENTSDKEFAIITEYKKNHWFMLKSQDASKAIQIVNTDPISEYPYDLYLLPQKKIWSELNRELPHADYSIALLANANNRLSLLSIVNDWPIYSPGNKEYVKWTGDRHRKPQ